METLGRRILLSILYSAGGKSSGESGERGAGRTRKRPMADAAPSTTFRLK